MDTLNKNQRAGFSAVAAITIWFAMRLIINGSIEHGDVIWGVLFAAMVGGIVFWLAGYKNPDGAERDRV